MCRKSLGRGEIRGCPDQPVQPATVFEFAAVDPEVAVLLRTDENPHEPRLWTVPGTLVESARHPLHTALFADGEPDPARDHRCGPGRTLTVRVVFPTRQDYGPKVAPADGVTGKRFLRNRGVRGYLSIAARTRLVAADRDGVPFVGRGDLLRIRARACRETAKYRAEHHGTRNPAVVLDRLRVPRREHAVVPGSHG
jgi:hypothetical protein